MAKGAGTTDEVATLLRRSVDEERRLLKRERRAELEVVERQDRLAEEQAQLDRARARLGRRRAELADAEARLRDRQAARAAGPDPVGGEGAPLPSAAPAPVRTAGRRIGTAPSNGKTGAEVPAPSR